MKPAIRHHQNGPSKVTELRDRINLWINLWISLWMTETFPVGPDILTAESLYRKEVPRRDRASPTLIICEMI